MEESESEPQSISIHALLAESDPGKVKVVEPGLAFLSTLSLRRATVPNHNHGQHNRNFYPRSPCGERRRLPINNSITLQFLSTLSLRRATQDKHHPHHERAFLSTLSLRRATEHTNNSSNANLHFYPRSPCGERPYQQGEERENQSISIHALLAESDLLVIRWLIHRKLFLSTLSLRRATRKVPLLGIK